MHRPFEVQEQLGLAKTTLRRRTERFTAWLSPGAQDSVTPSGHRTQRLYTDADVALLREIGARLDDGASFDAVELLLERGELLPGADVVASDNDDMERPAGPDSMEREPSGPDRAPSGSALAPLISHPLFLALDELRDALERSTAAEAARQAEQTAQYEATLAAMQAQTAALERQTAVQEQVLQALQQQAERAAQPPAAPTFGQRLRRLFTGGT